MTPVVGALLAQHAHASAPTIKFKASMDYCEMNEGRIFSDITLLNDGNEDVQINSVSSNFPELAFSIYPVTLFPATLNPHSSIYLGIDERVDNTDFRCGKSVKLFVIGQVLSEPFSLEVIVEEPHFPLG